MGAWLLYMGNKVKICVCGWYFYQDFYATLNSLRAAFDIVIIANKSGNAPGLPYILRENIGLEWGAYSYFLDNCWDGFSSVLYMHDDIKANADFFLNIQGTTLDQAFIFQNEFEYQQNYSHGRAFYASARFLNLCRLYGGIYYDKGNSGFIAPGYSWSTKPPEGCKDHNYAIREFTELVKRIAEDYPDMSVNKQIYSPNICLGVRGKFSLSSDKTQKSSSESIQRAR
jgi:hypothetical protein